MSKMTRREALGTLALAALAISVEDAAALMQRAARGAEPGSAPRFFTAHEWRTVRVLVDLILPADERSGSATDAMVPEFMDFMMVEYPAARAPMRAGLEWLDAESRRRFGAPFVEGGDAERTALLDDIAWPGRAPAELREGAAFFSRFRDLTASGFWSSRMGVEDLRYMGNTVVPEWKGCPPEALRKLGVSYEKDWAGRDT